MRTSGKPEVRCNPSRKNSFPMDARVKPGGNASKLESEPMRTSRERILTTHVGSLIRPPALQAIMRTKQAQKTYDHAAYETCLRDSVAEVVRRQVEVGIDAVSDGEYGKSISWNQYIVERMSGFELRGNPPGPGGRSGNPGLDRSRFPEFYAELDVRDPPANPETV